MRQGADYAKRVPPEPEVFIAQSGMISEAHLQSACCDLIADVARNQGQVQLKVAGASMVPALWPGDLVTVRSCDSSELQPGSIVVFRQNERLVVHRLMRADFARWVDSTHWADGCLVTRGDARSRCDKPVKAGEVLGRVESADAKWPPREFATLPSAQGSGLGFAPLPGLHGDLFAFGFPNAKVRSWGCRFGTREPGPLVPSP